MGSIFWDTNLFIYLIEGRPKELSDRAVRARQEALSRGDQLVTSALTLGEVLVQPLRAGRRDLALRYREMIRSGATIVPFDEGTAARFGQLRADFPALRPPDAVQLACAAEHGVSAFLTSDDRLKAVKVSGVQRIAAIAHWTGS